MNMMMSQSKLYARIDELEEHVRQLKEIINPKINPFAGRSKLSPQQAAILYALYRNEMCTMEYLDVITVDLGQSTGRGTEEGLVSNRTKVTVWKIREKLKHRIAIEAIRGVGYRIPKRDKEKLKKLLAK